MEEDWTRFGGLHADVAETLAFIARADFDGDLNKALKAMIIAYEAMCRLSDSGVDTAMAPYVDLMKAH